MRTIEDRKGMQLHSNVPYLPCTVVSLGTGFETGYNPGRAGVIGSELRRRESTAAAHAGRMPTG